MKKHPLERWGEMMGGKKSRWVVLGLWIAFAAILAFVFPQVNSVENYSGEDLPEYEMSMEASKLIDEQFSSDAGLPLLVVWYKEAGLALSDIQNIQSLYGELAENPLQTWKRGPFAREIPENPLRK